MLFFYFGFAVLFTSFNASSSTLSKESIMLACGWIRDIALRWNILDSTSTLLLSLVVEWRSLGEDGFGVKRPLPTLMSPLSSKQEQNKSLGPNIFPCLPFSVKLRGSIANGFTPSNEGKTPLIYLFYCVRILLLQEQFKNFTRLTWSLRRNVVRIQSGHFFAYCKGS